MDSVPETIDTAPPSVGFDEAFMLHHRAVYRAAYALVRDVGLPGHLRVTAGTEPETSAFLDAAAAVLPPLLED